MSKFTLYRADVDSARLARVLGKVPGVAVGSEPQDDREADAVADKPTDGATASTAPDEGENDVGDRVPDTDIVDEEEKSVLKTYGLLGLGVSMVMLGVATVGIWVYLRRKGGDGEAETPPPATGLEADEALSTGPSTGEPAPGSGEAGSERPSSALDTSMTGPDEPGEGEPADEAESETEPRGRTEGDRTDIEWTARDTTPGTTDEAEISAPEPAEPSADEDEPRPTESVDAAPLLGAAFLAVTGAVVRWLQRTDEA